MLEYCPMDPWAMLHHSDPTDFHISEPISMLWRILSSSFDCNIGFIDLLYTSFSWFYGLGQERKIAKPILSPFWNWSHFFLLYCLCCFGWFVRALYILKILILCHICCNMCPQEKEMQKSKMAVWGSLTNSCEKRGREKQRRKGKIYPFECRVPKKSKER